MVSALAISDLEPARTVSDANSRTTLKDMGHRRSATSLAEVTMAPTASSPHTEEGTGVAKVVKVVKVEKVVNMEREVLGTRGRGMRTQDSAGTSQ
jgi:hypothetical protein